MKSNYFIIKENEAIKFSNISGDYNKIHTDNLVGYNSLYGQKICHGCLVIIKTFRIIKIKKDLLKLNKYEVSIKFYKHFVYNNKIIIKFKKNKNSIHIKLFQNKEIAGEVEILKNVNFINVKKKIIRNRYQFKKEIIKRENIDNLLENISYYVGMVYPGENSLIKSININYDYNKSKDDKFLHIRSLKKDKRIPFIDNYMIYKDYFVNFESIERPKINVNLKKLNKNITKKLRLTKNNVLIIGASSGIGNDVLNMFCTNNKIKIIATYNKNKINFKNKNLKKIKIDVNTDLNKIIKIVDKNSPINIYYFATPKIYFDIQNRNLDRIYKKFFINIPSTIIKTNKNLNNNFFYPSTTYINNKSSYSLTKLKGEKIIKKINKNKIKINILKIDLINTKQNLSVLNYNVPNFRDLLNKNKEYQKKFFFN